MTHVISVDETRKKLSEIIDKAQYRNERFFVQKNKKPAAVILGAEDYEDLMEILVELQDKKFIKSLEKSRKEYERGEYYTHEELFKKLNINKNEI